MNPREVDWDRYEWEYYNDPEPDPEPEKPLSKAAFVAFWVGLILVNAAIEIGIMWALGMWR